MDNSLTIPLNICNLNNNKFIIPKNCEKLWFDIGTSINSPNGVQFLKRNKNGFVIGFEPNPQMYFTIYSMYYINQNKWLVDNNHPSALIEKNKRIKNQKRQIFNDTEEFINKNDYINRYIIIPCAISSNDGFEKLYKHNHEGSSSLNDSWHNINRNEYLYVKTYPLKKFIDMVPEYITFIEHVKIDCEGYDLNVIQSAGDSINRIAVITCEDKNCYNYLLNNNFSFIEEQNGGFSFINNNYKHLLSKLDYFIRV